MNIVMNVFYRAIPFALGWLFGRGVLDLTDTPKEYYGGIGSILLAVLCFAGWIYNRYKGDRND